jgi:fused signal recognition particle receptor
MHGYSIVVSFPIASLELMLEPRRKDDDERRSWLGRLSAGLTKTRFRLSGLLSGRSIEPALFEELESALLASDAGVEATRHLLARLRERSRGAQDGSQLRGELKSILIELLEPLEQPLELAGKKPCVIMLAGVNGAGKTTSIGKLAAYFRNGGHSVLLAAGDTFRAAAREQLAAWGSRNDLTVIAQSGGDPAAVVFDALVAARARGIDMVLADTAGRLPTQLHLMEEVKKIKRAIAKAQTGAPHEIWLVLDAGTGQNALNQLSAFDDALGLTGLVLTKLDGTAKGGILCAIAFAQSKGAGRRPIPVRFLGVGEGIDDLRPFRAREFVSALLE